MCSEEYPVVGIFGIHLLPLVLFKHQELADFHLVCNRRFEDCLHKLEVAWLQLLQ